MVSCSPRRPLTVVIILPVDSLRHVEVLEFYVIDPFLENAFYRFCFGMILEILIGFGLVKSRGY